MKNINNKNPERFSEREAAIPMAAGAEANVPDDKLTAIRAQMQEMQKTIGRLNANRGGR